jgi:hypothetical protein
MGKDEDIAIDLLEAAFGDRFVRDDSRIFSCGTDACAGEVDDTIDGQVAVEFAVGSGKQIQGFGAGGRLPPLSARVAHHHRHEERTLRLPNQRRVLSRHRRSVNRPASPPQGGRHVRRLSSLEEPNRSHCR